MTDHSPGRAAGHDGDDDYRLTAGTPQDAVPQQAPPRDAVPQDAVPGGGAAGAAGAADPRQGAVPDARVDAPHPGGAAPGAPVPGAADAPPPRVSGQPGWAYTPTEMATPQVPGRAGPTGGQAEQPVAPAAQGPVPGGYGYPDPQGAAPAGYGYPQPQIPPHVPPQAQPFAAAPTQGYAYPGVPPQGDPQAPGQPYPMPPTGRPPYEQQPTAQPPYGEVSYGEQPYGQAPYGQSPYGQDPYGQDPYGQDPYGQAAGYGEQAFPEGQPGAAPGIAGPGPWQQQMPPLPPLPAGGQPQPGLPYPGPGYPQQPAPTGGGLSRGALGALIAGGVALAAVAVTAVALTSGGGGNGGNGGGGGGGGDGTRTLSAGWTLPGTTSDHQIGTWVTGKYLVRATEAGVKAYNLADGTPAWTARPLSGPSVPCAMSPTVSASGLGTVGFGPNTSDCTTVVGVDTSSGKTLWSTALTTKNHTDASATTTFVDGQVGVIVNDGVLGGVGLTDGHVVWGYKPRGQYCNAYPYGGAGTVIVDDYCADVNPSYVVTAFDAATGKELWHKQGSDHVEFGAVVDNSPVVATLTDGTVNVYDSSGTPRPLTLKDGFESSLGAVGDSDTGARAVGPSTLLLPTRNTAASREGITAVNPATGATVWTYNGDTHQGAALVRPQQGDPADGGKVYAISLGPDYGENGSPELVSLDPATGRSTVVAKLPAKPSSFVYTTGTVYALPDGRVLLVAVDGEGTAVQIFK